MHLLWTLVFWAVAIVGSCFYGWFGFEAHREKRPERGPYFFHQVWFNFTGALTGWLALWSLRAQLTDCIFKSTCQPAFGWGEGVLAGLAFIGITGHLPWAFSRAVYGMSNVASAVKEAAAKATAPMK